MYSRESASSQRIIARVSKDHEGARRKTKRKMSFFATKLTAAGTMALKLQRFTVTLCAHRFRSKNLVNFFFKPGRASDLPIFYPAPVEERGQPG